MRICDVRWNNEKRTITMGRMTIALTTVEYRFLFPLRRGIPLTYTDLATLIYGSTFNQRIRIVMNKQVDRLRNKLRGSGVYVYCILGYGYILLPEMSPFEIMNDFEPERIIS